MRSALYALLALLALLSSQAVTAETEIPEVYVGFEDRSECDYDYNDFGMTMSASETYDPAGTLTRVTLAFEAVCHLAGDAHDIHIARGFAEGSLYVASLRRSRAAGGNETAEGLWRGAGDLDVVLFDTEHTLPRDRVTLVIDLTVSAEPRGGEPLTVLGRYDPWLDNRVTGEQLHVDDTQPYRDTGSEVPYVLILPSAGWQPPGEWACVTDLYPDFESYYVTRDPRFARWFEVEAR